MNVRSWNSEERPRCSTYVSICSNVPDAVTTASQDPIPRGRSRWPRRQRWRGGKESWLSTKKKEILMVKGSSGWEEEGRDGIWGESQAWKIVRAGRFCKTRSSALALSLPSVL